MDSGHSKPSLPFILTAALLLGASHLPDTSLWEPSQKLPFQNTSLLPVYSNFTHETGRETEV